MSRATGRRAGGSTKRLFELVPTEASARAEPYATSESQGISKTTVSGKHVFSKQVPSFTKSGRVKSGGSAFAGDAPTVTKVFERVPTENEASSGRQLKPQGPEGPPSEHRRERVRETAPRVWRRAKVFDESEAGNAAGVMRPQPRGTANSAGDAEDESMSDGSSTASSHAGGKPSKPSSGHKRRGRGSKQKRGKPAPPSSRNADDWAGDPVYEPHATSMTISDRIALLCGT
ncbi:hypothetical protein DIPPA_34227 [Diplonema papillatum]|nr:hypothetical protein DIPPA_34227 [Diplonema papillatum]